MVRAWIKPLVRPPCAYCEHWKAFPWTFFDCKTKEIVKGWFCRPCAVKVRETLNGN